MAIGVWDAEKFAAFRASPRGSARRRTLQNELVIENTPLVKVLVDQLCGWHKQTGRTKLGGCQGFSEIPWEDAYQGGLIALMKALEQFDPSKRKGRDRGSKYKISRYLLLKIRHELQVIVHSGGQIVRAPREAGIEVPVALVGEQEVLDGLGGGMQDGIAVVDEFITPQDIERWHRDGWTRDPRRILSERKMKARWEARTEALLERQQIDPAEPVASFLKLRCSVGPSARATEWEIDNAFRVDCRRARIEQMERADFLRAVSAVVPLRRVTIHARNRPDERGLAGVRLLESSAA